MPRITMKCPKCGSTSITRDALARWSDETQDWELSSLLDNTDCDDCGDEIDPDEVPLDTN